VHLIAEKNENTTLQLLRRSVDGKDHFFASYGRPIYVIRNMSGMPYSLLRLGFPETGEEYFGIEYMNSTNAEELTPHKHYEPRFFEDDDFFQQNYKNRGGAFEKQLENYTFTLHYTGRRWYGKYIIMSKEGKFLHRH
jgi:hypothetical protein